MTSLSFVPLGVGDAFSARWYSFCLLIEAGGERLLVDCPHPIRKILHESTPGAPIDIDDISAVVVTHLHADHCSGLEGFGYFSRFVLGRRAKLVMHPSVSARLWDGHLAAGMESLLAPAAKSSNAMRFDDYFDLVPLDFDKPLEIGPFAIRCRPTRHHVPTTALRVAANGRELGISADTSFDRALIDWLAESDLVIHETNYGIHTPYEELAKLPEELRKHMRLIHYPDDFDLESSVVEPLRQGERYAV